MRIGIYLETAGTGISRYLWQLLETLPFIDGEHEYYVYVDKASVLKGQQPYNPIFDRDFLIRGPIVACESVHPDLFRRIREDAINVFHAEFNSFPLHTICPTVLTIHDTSPILAPPSVLPPEWKREASKRMLLAIRLADHLVVPSHYVKQQLVEKLRVPSDKITQIYWGCPPFFRPVPQETARKTVKERFGISRPFVLTVGILNRRKNLKLLIEAFRKKLWKSHDLVLVGRRGWWADEILRLIEGDPTIHYLGTVPDRELLYLYAAAKCFAFSSQEEGFGFPPIEAMACGTPVVAQRCASLPEVIGNAGLLVEPENPLRFADAMERAICDRPLRATLRQRGLERAGEFRWEDTATKMLALYRQLVEV